MYVFPHVHYTGLDPKLHYLSQGYAILRVVELKKNMHCITSALLHNCNKLL